MSRGSHDLREHKELKINNVEWHPRIVVFRLTLYHPRSRKYLKITEFVDKKDIDGEEEGVVVEDN